MIYFTRALIIILSLFLCKISFAAEDKSITILAPKNMSFAITEIIRDYSRNKNIVITGSFNTPPKLVQDIEEGYPADIIITSHPDWIKHLKQKGLINISSITNFMEDKLVLITSKSYYNSNKEIIENIINADDKTKYKFYKDFTVTIGDSDNDIIANYALQVINNSPIFAKKVKIAVSNDVKKSILGQENNLAITNYTNTYDNANITILESFDKDLHQRFIYQIAAIAGENMTEAQNFIKFLKSEETLNIMSKYGFEVIE